MLTCYPGAVGAKPNVSRASVGDSKRMLDSDDTSTLKLTLILPKLTDCTLFQLQMLHSLASATRM